MSQLNNIQKGLNSLGSLVANTELRVIITSAKQANLKQTTKINYFYLIRYYLSVIKLLPALCMQFIRALPYLMFHQFVSIYQSTKSKSATMVSAEPSSYFDKTFCFHRETKSKIQRLSNNYAVLYISDNLFYVLVLLFNDQQIHLFVAAGSKEYKQFISLGFRATIITDKKPSTFLLILIHFCC